MKTKVVQVFSKKDEEFVNILINIGTKKNFARVLVFPLNRMEGTIREIERVADMSKPDVSQAVKYMAEQGWVKTEEIPPEKKGRSTKKVSLAIPFEDIMQVIEDTKKTQVNHQLALLQKARAFVA